MADPRLPADVRATDEQFYDAEVAPLLLQAAKKCEGRGLPMFAVVEWKREPGDFERNPDDDNDDPYMSGETSVRHDRASERMLAAKRAMYPPSFLALTITSGAR